MMISCDQPTSQPKSSTNQSKSTAVVETQSTQYRDITIDELNTAYGNASYILLDVRTPEEVANGMIDGAQHIDFVATDFEQRINQLDRSGNYVVYCRSGGRSTKACQMMQSKGFENIANLEGGYLAYTDSQ